MNEGRKVDRRAAAREVFRALRGVEIELHGFCNRRCDFCPNSFLERTREMRMEERVFTDLVDELADAGFGGVVSFSRYNEPLAMPELLAERAEYVRKRLPRSKLVANTNGDYLDAATLAGLRIDELTIMDYDGQGVRAGAARLEELGAVVTARTATYVLARCGALDIAFYGDWLADAELQDRGGALPSLEGPLRRDPCLYPTRYAAVDWNGAVMPCCDMRSDNPDHAPFVLGYLHEQTLGEILTSARAVNIRRRTSSGAPDLAPCRHCTRKLGRYIRDRAPGVLYERK